MSLNLAAVIFMGGYVLAIVVVALLMIIRPGGGSVQLPAPAGAVGAPGPRQEIRLGGAAESFGIVRGRVLAVLLQPDSRHIQELALATALGLVEDGHVPADAILSADGEVVQLTEFWTDPPLDGTGPQPIALRKDMTVLSAERKRLGKLRLVCFEKDSRMVTDLVVAGRRSTPSLRLVPFERARAASPSAIVTELNTREWSSLPPFASDQALRQAVLDGLATDPALQPFQRSLTVEVEDQRVGLRGYVTDRAAADRATHLAQAVPGVLGVDAAIVADEPLAEAVSQALSRDPASATASVQVRSRFGVVEIAGEAPDAATVARLEDVASHVPGVLSVRNATVARQ